MNMTQENKKAFLLYTSFWKGIESLENEDLGLLTRAIFHHQIHQEIIELPKHLKMAFDFMLIQFEIDEGKWQKRADRAKENGAKGGRPKKNPENPVGYLETQETQPVILEPRKPVDVDVDVDVEYIDTVASPVHEIVDNLEENSGMIRIGTLLKKFEGINQGKKLPPNYWQSRALHFMDKLKVPQNDRPIIFKYFKAKLNLMEAICSYILESKTTIKNPVAYILYEYKRRQNL